MIFGLAPIRPTIARPIKDADESTLSPAQILEAQPIQNLREALAAIHEARWDDAETSLINGCGSGDPRFLNLMGVVCQGREQWKQARRFFGKALKADRGYTPARQNMQRLYELHTFGRTVLPVALFDCEEVLAAESRIARVLMRQ